MTTPAFSAFDPSEHILNWAINSRPHYKRLVRLSVPGNFISAVDRSSYAMSLALQTYCDMRPDRSDYSESDILRAALAMIEWKVEQ